MSKRNSTPSTDWLAAAKDARSHGASIFMCAALALIDIAESLRVVANFCERESIYVRMCK